jgi:hypothetical protein
MERTIQHKDPQTVHGRVQGHVGRRTVVDSHEVDQPEIDDVLAQFRIDDRAQRLPDAVRQRFPIRRFRRDGHDLVPMRTNRR